MLYRRKTWEGKKLIVDSKLKIAESDRYVHSNILSIYTFVL